MVALQDTSYARDPLSALLHEAGAPLLFPDLVSDLAPPAPGRPVLRLVQRSASSAEAERFAEFLRTRDEKLFEPIFRAHWPSIVRYVKARLFETPSAVEDYAQEVFIRASATSTFDPDKAPTLRGYLRGIARGVLRQNIPMRERSSVHCSRDGLEELAERALDWKIAQSIYAPPTPEELYEEQESERKIEASMARRASRRPDFDGVPLTREEVGARRAITALTERNGVNPTVKEIAREIGLSHECVRRQVEHMREKCRAVFEKEPGDKEYRVALVGAPRLLDGIAPFERTIPDALDIAMYERGARPLTRHQRGVFDVIVKWMQERGYVPSYEEIWRALGHEDITGASSVCLAIEQLAVKGWIEKPARKFRQIRILAPVEGITDRKPITPLVQQTVQLVAELTEQLQRPPTTSEIAAALGVKNAKAHARINGARESGWLTQPVTLVRDAQPAPGRKLLSARDQVVLEVLVRLVCDRGYATSGDVAKELKCSLSCASIAVSRLVKKGWVERTTKGRGARIALLFSEGELRASALKISARERA